MRRPWISDLELARRFTAETCRACDGSKFERYGSGYCQTCDGTGKQPKPREQLCAACGGTTSHCIECRGTGRPHVRCDGCRGNGAIGGLVCGDCEGRRVLDVAIDARIIDIQRERAAAKAAGLATSTPKLLGPAQELTPRRPASGTASAPRSQGATPARPRTPPTSAAPAVATQARRPLPWPPAPPPQSPPPQGPYRAEPEIVESRVERDEHAERAMREAWDAAEGPQPGARKRRAA